MKPQRLSSDLILIRLFFFFIYHIGMQFIALSCPFFPGESHEYPWERKRKVVGCHIRTLNKNILQS